MKDIRDFFQCLEEQKTTGLVFRVTYNDGSCSYKLVNSEEISVIRVHKFNEDHLMYEETEITPSKEAVEKYDLHDCELKYLGKYDPF
jgi:hypothetical protein